MKYLFIQKEITCLFLISIFIKNVGKSGQVLLNPVPSLIWPLESASLIPFN